MKLEDLVVFIEESGGICTASQLKKAGFLPGIISHAHKQGLIDKLTRGVYCSVDVFGDDFAAVNARWKKCIISHGSALFILGLSDRVPSHLDVTVPNGYNPTKLRTEFPGIRIHRVSPDIYQKGLIEAKTPEGNSVRIYNAERSIADLIKARTHRGADPQLIHDAMTKYFRSEKRNLQNLSSMCEMLDVRNELQIYLEVLS